MSDTKQRICVQLCPLTANKITVWLDVTQMSSDAHVFRLIMFQYEELVHYSGSEGMPVGGYGDNVRPFPPPEYGPTIPDSLKHHKDQIYGWACVSEILAVVQMNYVSC